MPKSPSQDEKERFMRRAVEISQEGPSAGLGNPYGALIVKDGKIIAESANRCLIDNDPTAHAEVAAIRQACKELKTSDLTGCHVYTSCHPCMMCLAAIYWARVEAFFYAVTCEEYRPCVLTKEWQQMKEDESKPKEEKAVPREWIASCADVAHQIGEEWLLAEAGGRIKSVVS